MREIKFRGKNLNCEWVYGVPVKYVENSYDRNDLVSMVNEVSNDELDYWVATVDYDLVEKETVGQYTGLKDCNGVEIYEGDILKIFHENEDDFYESKVYWSMVRASFTTDVLEFIDLTSTFKENNENLEVIGNIHEEDK